MHYMDWFWWAISILFWATVWGFATNSVIKNKGYDDNWFWWGFLFGFIAFIVALTKPEVYYNSQNYQHQENRLINNYHSYEFEHLADTVGNDTEKPGTFKMVIGNVSVEIIIRLIEAFVLSVPCLFPR